MMARLLLYLYLVMFGFTMLAGQQTVGLAIGP